MNPRERGFLLLTSQLGDPMRDPLTVAQFRMLAQRIAVAERSMEERNLAERDLIALGCSSAMAQRILRLLGDGDVLDHYLRRGLRAGCRPISRISGDYPMTVHHRLGLDAPGSLWIKGDAALLSLPAVALVGSRDIGGQNLKFAQQVGYQAARQGFVLVSGNARGADRAAQESCLAAGGQVISVVADELQRHSLRENLLYISEDGFDLDFSGQRALSRNRVIHSMGLRTFVAQSGYQHGGTWDGTAKNLRCGWSPVYCFNDGSVAAEKLSDMGAMPVGFADLDDFSALNIEYSGFFDQ